MDLVRKLKFLFQSLLRLVGLIIRMSKNKKIEAIIVIYNTFFKATNAACMFQQNNKQQAKQAKNERRGNLPNY